MGRVCQIIGYVTILLPLVPIAWAISRLISMDGGGSDFVATLVFSAPFVGIMVGGVLLVTFGSLLMEVIELRRVNEYAASLLSKIADKR